MGVDSEHTAQVSLSLDNEQLAELYERVSRERQFKSGQQLIKEFDLRDGERVLDIGAGLRAEHVADIVGPTGLVIGIDPLPHRIEIAQRRARPNLRRPRSPLSRPDRASYWRPDWSRAAIASRKPTVSFFFIG